MSSHRYRKAGKYVAICNNGRFDGHYVKVFEYPQEFIDNYYRHTIIPAPDAAWYFLNRVDFAACLEAVYPIEIFEKLHDARLKFEAKETEVCEGIVKGGVNSKPSSPPPAPPLGQGGFRTNVDGHDI